MMVRSHLLTGAALAMVLSLASVGAAAAQTTSDSPTPATTAPGGAVSGDDGNPLVSSTEVPTTSALTSEQATTTLALPEDSDECPAVQLIAINGTTESGRNDSVSADTGWMSQVAQPAVREANGDGTERMSRAYVPYPASFGGWTEGEEETTYAESLEVGIENAGELISQTVEACPETKIFLSGYSQGAQVASAVTRDIGAGQGPAEPDQLAGTALMSDPTREPGAGVFAETGQSSPGAVPGTTGTEVSGVDAAGAAPVAEGGGIAPNTSAEDFGAVSDRVASFCVPGDLACDTPENSPILRLVANVAGTTTMDEVTQDPVRALTNIGTITGNSVLFSAADTINEDVQFSAGQGFTVSPATSSEDTTLGRMARYSDPDLDPAQHMDSVVQAGMNLAGMAMGATITVAQEVLTPENIGMIMAAGAANPAAGAAVLAGQLAVASTELVTPATVNSGLQRLASEIEHTVGTDDGLAQLAADVGTWNSVESHGMYGEMPFSSTGLTPAGIAQQWAVAAADDVAASRGMEPSERTELAQLDRADQLRQGGSSTTRQSVEQQELDTAALTEALSTVT